MAAKCGACMAAEFIGTLAFAFVGTLAIHHSAGNLLLIAAAHGLILSIMVTAAMPTSGGHLNPAVTLAFLVTGRIKPGEAIAYIFAQLAGATVGAFCIYGVYGGGSSGAAVVAEGAFALAHGVTIQAALLAEIVATFFLLFAVHGTAADPRARNVGGFAIGLTVGADILAIGPLTGACMNPARMFGPTVVASIVGAPGTPWMNNWLFWVGPIIGGCLAAMLYSGLMWPRAEKT